MTQHIYPVLPIPHHLAHEVLDKSAGNWAAWEKTVLACLVLAGLDGHLAGTHSCPDPVVDPAGTATWLANDRAVVSFLALKASRSEQTYIASHAAGGAKTVWDALVARHFDARTQVRLMREAFSMRYGREPPAAVSARIDALATHILAMGPISKSTLVSAVMVNAVQGDIHNLNVPEVMDIDSNPTRPNVNNRADSGQEKALSAITAELTTLQRELSPAVSAFSTQGSDEAEWMCLLEQLFQVLGRVDAIAIAPEWDQAIAARRKVHDEVHQLQSTLERSTDPNSAEPREEPPAPRVSEGEQNAMTSIAAEMATVENEVAPAIGDYLQWGADEKRRSRLMELLVQSLERLDGIAMEPAWEEARIKRKRAVEEIQRVLNTLDWSSARSAGPDPRHHIGEEEQSIIAQIASELANVHNVLAPAVATFPRPSLQSNETEQKHLSRLLFETVERLDATRVNQDWTQARQERRNAVKVVEQLLSTLDGLPTCTEEQNALQTIASERSNIQFLLFPAVTVYLGSPNEREQARLSELLFLALERLDGVALEATWDQARRARRETVKEVQTLQNSIESPPPSNELSSEQSGERAALSRIASERSTIQSELLPAIVLFARTFQPSTSSTPGPNEKERLRLSELSLRFLERLDAVSVEPDWEEARKERKSAVKEVQALQAMLDAL